MTIKEFVEMCENINNNIKECIEMVNQMVED